MYEDQHARSVLYFVSPPLPPACSSFFPFPLPSIAAPLPPLIFPTSFFFPSHANSYLSLFYLFVYFPSFCFLSWLFFLLPPCFFTSPLPSPSTSSISVSFSSLPCLPFSFPSPISSYISLFLYFFLLFFPSLLFSPQPPLNMFLFFSSLPY